MGDERREPSRTIEAAKIVALCILGATIYGIVHDQFTARAYLPYFTEWPPHAGLVESDDPTMVGLVWGVVATWWVGLILGIPLAWAATSGEGRWMGWRDLAVPLGSCLAALGALAAVGYRTSLAIGFSTNPEIPGPAVAAGDLAGLRAFSAVLVAHNVSYTGGAAVGLALVLYAFIRRRKMRFSP